MKNLKAN